MYSKLCNELSNLDLVSHFLFHNQITSICLYNHERGNNVILCENILIVYVNALKFIHCWITISSVVLGCEAPMCGLVNHKKVTKPNNGQLNGCKHILIAMRLNFF